MASCPFCHNQLIETKSATGIHRVCSNCSSRAVGLAVLRKEFDKQTINSLWQNALVETLQNGPPCPSCSKQLTKVNNGSISPLIEADVCKVCMMICFESEDWARLPLLPPQQAAPDVPPEVREALAMAKVEAMAEDARKAQQNDAPDEKWKYIPALIGMPVAVDAEDYDQFPWLTFSIIAITCTISLGALYSDPTVLKQFAFIPAKFGRSGGITFLSSFFLHAGLLHLIGNMYALYLFGSKTENYLGPLKYALLILTATLCSSFLFLFTHLNTIRPVIGASGGVAGVMAFYTLQFPKTEFAIMLRFMWLRLPAYAWMLFWMFLQVVVLIKQRTGLGNVAVEGHIGGLIGGFCLWLLWRKLHPEQKPIVPKHKW